jgi:hypothetical protein
MYLDLYIGHINCVTEFNIHFRGIGTSFDQFQRLCAYIKIFKFEYIHISIGMERLIDQFHAIVREFRLKRHDLLDYHNNKFDRDYVEFNVKVKNAHFFINSFLLIT